MRLILTVFLICSVNSIWCQVENENTNFRAIIGMNDNDSTIKTDTLDNGENWMKEAEFPGGIGAMSEYINERLVMDSVKLGDVAVTKLYVSYVINELGEVKDVSVLRGISPSVDSKVIEIFNGMPKWNPKMEMGVAVSQRYNMPLSIEFK
ncbi:MAG: hypothetical protein R2809_10505 [Flavobacteriales bacterium]